MQQQNKGNNQQFLIFFLLCITVLALCTTVWALFFRHPDRMLMPDYAPVAAEANATPIPGDSATADKAETGSGSVSLTYSNLVNIDLGEMHASLLFANPGKSNQDMVLQLVIQDAVILQTGRLIPGNQITELNMTADAAAMLAPGGYEGEFLVSYYDPSTGEKAIVNTRIPVSVTVTD